MNKLGLSPKKQVPFDVDEDPIEIESKTKTEMFEESEEPQPISN